MKVFLSLFILISLLTGCKKMVEVDPPINKVTGSEVFASDATAGLSVTGLYNKMMLNNSFIASGAMTLYCGLAADEIVNEVPGTNDEFATNSISVSNSVVEQNFWDNAYSLIYHANSIIKGVQNSKTMTGGARLQYEAEARFSRAFIYFNLVNIFGNVPLVLTTDYLASSDLARTPAPAIYNQILDDLSFAFQSLPAAYPAGDRTRPSKWAALSMLARVYLYNRDWAHASAAASMVIASSGASLMPDLNKVFKQGSTETIWQLAPVVTSIDTWDGNNFIPGTGTVPNYSLRSGLVSLFDSTDQRGKKWMQSITVAGTRYFYSYKYKIKSGSTIDEDYVVLRLAELYLVRAEANAHLNNTSDAEADLNSIKNRAGLSAFHAATSAALLTEIEKERAREFFVEWGHRWLDLRRTNRADDVLGALKPGWQPADTLFPIPFNEIKKNPNLKQNPGY